jgi:flavin reductase (DIM6/NTAB) family NADH-FMN oxidoreductase RutF
MNLQWNDRRTRQFITNVGLITSDGPFGPDVMTAEWTHHISYSPSLIAVNVRGEDATAYNIIESKEFGVNLGDVDKVGVLKGMDVMFYNGNKIKTLMVSGCAMNAECKLQRHEEIGDHIMFIGEVVEISADENVRPLIYHNGKYWILRENIEKPSSDVLTKIEKLVEQFKK